jgi:hypothetical protein
MLCRPLRQLLLAAFLCAPIAAAQQSTTTLPQIPDPSGPYGIGRVGYHWIDMSRPDDYSPNRHRELMVYFWYPTAKSADAKGAYITGATQMESDLNAAPPLHREFGGLWAPILSGQISCHAIDHAPIAKNRTPFPVVTFSHGIDSMSFYYTVLIEDLVSHGYVVASIEHTYVSRAVWFPDGRVITFHQDRPPADLPASERPNWMMKQATIGINVGAADVRFVVDRITELNHDKKNFALAGTLDLKHIAAMGHSAGAEFAVRACQLDSRFVACVDLDGGIVPVAALPLYPDNPNMRQPLLYLEAFHPDNRMGGTPEQIAEYKKVRERQLSELPRGSYAVVLHSPEIAHPSFSDIPLILHGREGYPETPIVEHNHKLIKQFILGFLDQTLRHRPSPIFDGCTSPFPEAIVTGYGR